MTNLLMLLFVNTELSEVIIAKMEPKSSSYLAE